MSYRYSLDPVDSRRGYNLEEQEIRAPKWIALFTIFFTIVRLKLRWSIVHMLAGHSPWGQCFDLSVSRFYSDPPSFLCYNKKDYLRQIASTGYSFFYIIFGIQLSLICTLAPLLEIWKHLSLLSAHLIDRISPQWMQVWRITNGHVSILTPEGDYLRDHYFSVGLLLEVSGT